MFYMFLFYFKMMEANGVLLGQKHAFKTQIVQIRGLATDSVPNINFTLITSNSQAAALLFYNQTLIQVRDRYKCVVNDYAVKSNVLAIINSAGFTAYQLFAYIFAFLNLGILLLALAKMDLPKAVSLTKF